MNRGAIVFSTIGSRGRGSESCVDTQLPPLPHSGLPQCLTDHGAAPSIIQLFESWVKAADQTTNGVIVINRQRERYSDTTVDKALRWLIKHHLVMKVEDGLGRGNGSRYFIRWSFKHPNLSTRQKTVNHPQPAKRVNPHPIEEKHKRSVAENGRSGVQSFAQSKAYRWAMSRARATIGELTSPSYRSQPGAFAVDLQRDPGESWTTSGDQQQQQRPQRRPETPYLQAFARTLKLAVERKAVRPGTQLGEFVKGFTQLVVWNWRWEADPHKAYSFILGLGRGEIAIARRDRQLEAEARQRERERQEAEAHPLSELLLEEGVSSMSQLIKRLARSGGEG